MSIRQIENWPQKQLKPAEFPALLREIPDTPTLLYMRGTMPSDGLKYLCVVGSRACSPYGRRVCASLIAGLASYPIAIVSGLALGIDGEALKAALDVGLPAVAILPSSVDNASLYPSTNRALAQRILARGGVLMSESKSPHKAAIYDFPKRDRLMAAMAHASIIIEAGEKSGTLITARLALDYNREVLAVPHELGKETGKGVNRLIREGATLVRTSDDILLALGFEPKVDPLQGILPTDLSRAEAKIMEALTGAKIKDELLEETGISAQEAGIALSSLLIRGLIIERLGKIERV
ncbi:MAG: DNA-processing protein DprA [Minisyncoccia bacterium]|jgi:DNA processing protein